MTQFFRISVDIDEVKNINNDDIPLKEGNVLVIGQTGVGKTTLVNEILNINVKQNSSLNPSTNHINIYRGFDIDNLLLIKMIDTIGFSDLNKSNSQVIDRIRKFVNGCPISYLNEILIVMKCDRMSKQEENDLLIFLKKMCEESKSITSLCFTHCKQKEIDYRRYFDDIMHREISKYIGKNVYFIDIDHKRKDKTKQVLTIMKKEFCSEKTIHFNKLFDSPLFGHKNEATKPKIYYEDVNKQTNDDNG